MSISLYSNSDELSTLSGSSGPGHRIRLVNACSSPRRPVGIVTRQMMMPRQNPEYSTSSSSSSSAGSLSQSPEVGPMRPPVVSRPVSLQRSADPSDLDIDALIAGVTAASPSLRNNETDLLDFVDELVEEEDRLREELRVQDRLKARAELIKSIAEAKAAGKTPKTFDWGMLYRDEKDTGGPLFEVTPYEPTPGFDFSNNVDWAELFFKEKYAPFEAANADSELMEKLRQKSQAEDAVADMKLKMAWCGNGDSSAAVPSRLSVGLRVPQTPTAVRPQTSRSVSERLMPMTTRLAVPQPSWPQSKSTSMADRRRPSAVYRRQASKSPSPPLCLPQSPSPPLDRHAKSMSPQFRGVSKSPPQATQPRWQLSKSTQAAAPRYQLKPVNPTAPSRRPGMDALAARSEPARRPAKTTKRPNSGRFSNMFKDSESRQRGPARKPEKMVWQTYTAAEYFK